MKETTSVQLPLELQEDIRTYLFLALPLCVLRMDEQQTPWFYENFVNIYLSGQYHFQYTGINFGGEGPFDQFDKEIHHCANMKGVNINDLMADRLHKGYYCYVKFEEFFLSASPAFQKRLFLHDSLIYGFDADTWEFLAVAMNGKQQLAFLRYRPEELNYAFEISLPGNDQVVFFKPRPHPAPYVFSAERFMRRLEDYLYSRDRTDEQYIHLEDQLPLACGWEANRKFWQHLKESRDFGFMTFRALHFLYEHKNGLLHRFEYIESLYRSPALESFLPELKDLAEQFDAVRLLIMRCRLYEEKGWTPEKLAPVQDQILAGLETAIYREREVLFRGLEALKKLTLPWEGTLVPSAANIAPQAEIQVNHYRYPHGPYPFSRDTTFTWKKARRLAAVQAPSRGLVQVYADGRPAGLCSHVDESARPVCIPLRDVKAKTLTVSLYSAFPFAYDGEDSGIAVYEAEAGKTACTEPADA